MAKLTRVTGKVFGETASPSGDNPEIGQFGSAKSGEYLGTNNVAVIQAKTAWSNGWIDAVTPDTQFPTLPEMTGVHKVLSYQSTYILQQGIPEWDEGTTYYENGFCSYNGTIYKSIADENTNNNPSSSPTKWEVANSVDTTNLANIDLSNLSLTGEARFSGKANVTLNNISPSSTTKQVFIGWGIPNYGAKVEKTLGTVYEATQPGIVYANSSRSGGIRIEVNGFKVEQNYTSTSSFNHRFTGWALVAPGDEYAAYTSGEGGDGGSAPVAYFIPMRGV